IRMAHERDDVLFRACLVTRDDVKWADGFLATLSSNFEVVQIGAAHHLTRFRGAHPRRYAADADVDRCVFQIQQMTLTQSLGAPGSLEVLLHRSDQRVSSFLVRQPRPVQRRTKAEPPPSSLPAPGFGELNDAFGYHLFKLTPK